MNIADIKYWILYNHPWALTEGGKWTVYHSNYLNSVQKLTMSEIQKIETPK